MPHLLVDAMQPGNRPIFHAFTTKFQGKTNRIITAVQLFKAFDPAKNPTPPFPPHSTTALWDTGATGSVLTKGTVEALGLEPVGRVKVSHAGGSGDSNTYLVNFFLPNKVVIAGALVTECENVAGEFGAIIGMDIITGGDLAITNVNEQTWVTFRLPSIERIDYVLEANRIIFAGVGRNDPCPCGKKDDQGKPIKYKKCHG